MSEQPVEAYPLCWPLSRPRTQYRQQARFKTSFAKAHDHIVAEVLRLGGRNSIISTNIELRRDGLHIEALRMAYAKAAEPYFARLVQLRNLRPTPPIIVALNEVMLTAKVKP